MKKIWHILFLLLVPALLFAGTTVYNAAPGVVSDTAGNISVTGAIAAGGVVTGKVKTVTITSAEGVHDGSNDVAVLTDSGETWPVNGYVGMTLYNVTDGSSTVVTANTATTMTGVLSGGTGNDWDTNDVWAVAPGPAQSGSIFFIGAATTILHPATVGYVARYYSTAANVVKVDPQSGSMQIRLNGALLTAGYELDSAGAAGDFIVIENTTATEGVTLERSGTWADGGAS